ncbi:hypothetical protein BRC91_11925 [Halobacteriales archaeon QS_4_62_28]|nr:MAG: hypothetical protein BRC91_11925 [Halobacteriales archaeon QS_4_62_28]
MAETEHITVATTSSGVGGQGEPGRSVDLPVLELLTGRGFITGKSGGGKSILEGTPVHTRNGRQPIEDVDEGQAVLSLNKHTYEQEFREVQATIEHSDDRLLKITLEDGTELVGTEDHSFLTVDNLEIVPVRGDELEEGTWMPVARELPSAESVTDIDLAEYVGDANNVVVDGETIRSGSRTEDRCVDLDFDAGKEIGLYLAEGSFDSGETLQISNVDDDIHDFLDRRGFNVYERTCNKGFQPYARFLRTEFGSGAGEKSVPNWAFDAPAPFRAGLLSGYFDGDGTIGSDEVTVISKSPALLDRVRTLLRQFGISSTVRDKFTVHDGDRQRYRRLRVDAFAIPAFREVVDLSVADKQSKLDRFAQRLDDGDTYNRKDMIPNFGSVLNAAAREKGWTTGDSHQSAGASLHQHTRKQKVGRETYNRLVDELGIEGRARAFGRSDVQWKRIVSIEAVDEERTVYDLDVEHNDNFVADGVFVHNSNTASVIAENLLDNGFGLLIVDIDGEYYGLKEEYEILHVGGDEECDIQVTVEHAEKIASLALEQNVPIILDISSFLDQEEAEELLTQVAKQLFVKAKKQKQPFLMLVEECHEWIPEKGSVNEVGKMLIKIGKRGRKHGLGIVGISQRPADVKKDYITQCDWLVWHRLTWNNDTKVVGRIIDSEYANAVEELDDGEAFLMTDWAESIRRVQFHRKQTFDAGATPGLDDFERPELKSVSEDLVSELETISDEKAQTEDRIRELREELDKKNSRIAELETELQDARDMTRMAEQFTDALLNHVEGYNPGRTEKEKQRKRQARLTGDAMTSDGPDETSSPDETTGGGFGDAFGAFADDGPAIAGGIKNGESDDTAFEFEPAAFAEASDEGDGDPAAAFDAPPDDSDDDVVETDDTGADGEAASAEALAAEEAAANGSGSESVDEQANETHTGSPGIQHRFLVDLRTDIAEMDEKTRRMLAYYVEQGSDTPLNAHFSAGGSGDRTNAYAHNRQLRLAGFVEHVGRGRYAPRLQDLVRESAPDDLPASDVVDAVMTLRETITVE